MLMQEGWSERLGESNCHQASITSLYGHRVDPVGELKQLI